MVERPDDSAANNLIGKSTGLNISYRRDLQKLMDQAAELIIDTGGRTTDKLLFQLAVHGMANGDVLDEVTIQEKYKNVEDFAACAVGKAMAVVRPRDEYPTGDYITEMMYVPAREGTRAIPDISYYLQSRSNYYFGWIELAVAGMMHFSSDGERIEQTNGKDYARLAAIKGGRPAERYAAVFEGREDKYIVGLSDIYQQRPLRWDHPESGQIFDRVMTLATQSFPDGIH